MITKKYTVTGMSCAACQAAVERAVSALNGVSEAAVSLMTHSMTLTYDEAVLSEDALFAAVRNAGYGAGEWVRREVTEAGEEQACRSLERRLILSAVFAVLMMYVTMGHRIGLPLPAFMNPHGASFEPIVYAAVQLGLSLPVIAVNRSYFLDGFRGVLHGSANMNTLVGTGAAASFFYGIYILVRMIVGFRRGEEVHEYSSELYFESVTMILTLITLGRLLEARARRHTSDAVRKLMALTPKTAEVFRNGETVTIPSEALAVGDRIAVRAGSSVPCDGIVLTGGGAADESVLTGESVPVPKNPGDTLICGTVLTSGYAEMETVHVGEDTTVAKITQLVEDASSSKAPVQKLADRISRIFVPTVCAIALITFVLWWTLGGELHRAVGFGISVLVISCPCALGLATPTAVMCGVGRGAGLGILIKSADAIDVLHRATVAVLDKTGTITEGRMRVSDVIPFDPDEKLDEKTLLRAAAALEAKSEHPIGAAIASYAADSGIPAEPASDFEQTFGGGVSGTVQGAAWLGGNSEFLASHGVTIPPEAEARSRTLAESGKTTVLFAGNGRLCGLIALADPIRSTSRRAIRELKQLGLEPVMLTGDGRTTANAIAAEAEIERVIADVRPEGKSAAVEALMAGDAYGDGKRRYCVMIGDGVNDAPALAMADCGMAVAHGTDIAMESAGVVLVHSDLTDAARAVSLSHAVMRTIRENLVWAFGYNVLCIPIAAGALAPAFGIALTPMIASAAMSLSSVCVVSNALRLRSWKPKF